MPDIINQNILRREIRRIVKDELEKQIPKTQVNSLWKYLNQIKEQVKILEEKQKNKNPKSI